MLHTTLLALSLSATAFCNYDLPRSNNEFAISLYAEGGRTNQGNFVYSPYSLFSCLSAAYMGARGETAEEMERALRLEGEQSQLPCAMQLLSTQLTSKGQLKVAHHLFTSDEIPLLPEFCTALHLGFKAQIEQLDFHFPERVRGTINQVISAETEGKIRELLPGGAIDEETRLVLTSTAYFSGAFARPFQERNTALSLFTMESGETAQVAMMNQIASFPYFENESMQLLLMPFTGSAGDFACFVMLPKECGLELLEEELCACFFRHALNGATHKRVQVRLPKFTFSTQWEMSGALRSIGMDRALSLKADFSGIDGKRDLHLSRIVHETFFSLDENGVTAAAATGATFNVTTSIDSACPILFNADRPFIFGICDLQTKTLLFLGKYTHLGRT